MMGQANTLKAAFQHVVDVRGFDVAGTNAMNDPAYQKASYEAKRLFDEILGLIGKENWGLLNKFESQITACNVFFTDYAYRQGLADGIALREELGLTGLERVVG